MASLPEFYELIGIDAGDWQGFSAGLPAHYRRVRIPKRRSGHRELLVPDQIVMEAQRRLLDGLYLAFDIPRHVTGGVPAGSIKKHARPHVGKTWVATFDIQDFFGQVCSASVASALLELGFTNDVVRAVCELGFIGGILPQGAPTSPLLANLALADVDRRILRLTKRRGLRYTRYLDDLAISGDSDFRELRGPIAAHCERAGFPLRPDKEAFMKQGTQQIVTGLVVNSRMRPTAEFYRRLKEDLRTLDVVRDISHRRAAAGRIAHLAQFDPETAAEMRSDIGTVN